MNYVRCLAAMATAASIALVSPLVLAGQDPEETVPPNALIEKPGKQIEAERVKMVRKGEKFIVPTCRVAFRLQNAASASTDSRLQNLGCNSGSYSNCKSDARVSMSVYLGNVPPAEMQAATDAVCADFVEQLKTVGLPVVTWKELPGNKAYDEIAFAKFKGEDGVYHEKYNASDYIVMGPSTGKLFFTHENLGLGDQGPMALGNWRAMNEMSAKEKAVVLVPHFMVDFASMSSSGNSMLKNTAEVGAAPALKFEPGSTRLYMYQAKMRLAGDMGGITARDMKPMSEDFGVLKNQSEVSNEWLVGPMANIFGAQGLSVNKKVNKVLIADPAKYRDGVIGGGKVMNGVYAHIIKGYLND